MYNLTVETEIQIRDAWRELSQFERSRIFTDAVLKNSLYSCTRKEFIESIHGLSWYFLSLFPFEICELLSQALDNNPIDEDKPAFMDIGGIFEDIIFDLLGPSVVKEIISDPKQLTLK